MHRQERMRLFRIRIARDHCGVLRALRMLIFTCAFLLLISASFGRSIAHAGSEDITIKAMRLLTRTTGWVLVGQQLFWTINAGRTWKDITPSGRGKGTIDAVFFLNNRTGWALLSQAKTENGHTNLNVAYTADSGTARSYSMTVVAHSRRTYR